MAWSTGTCAIVSQTKEEKKKDTEAATKPDQPFSRLHCGGNTERYVVGLGFMTDGWWDTFLAAVRAKTRYHKVPAIKQLDDDNDPRIYIPSSGNIQYLIIPVSIAN